MEVTLVNTAAGRGPARLVAPPPFGYVLVSAAVEPPPSPGPPVPRRSRRRAALVEQLSPIAGHVERVEGVDGAGHGLWGGGRPATPAYARDHAARIARYDVVVRVEVGSPPLIPSVEAAEPVRRLLDAVSASADEVHVLRARCVKSLGDAEKSPNGLFLLNYFVAEEPEVALALWDHLAGWYQHATGLDNSTLLGPARGRGLRHG
jgi:hypothetical protein